MLTLLEELGEAGQSHIVPIEVGKQGVVNVAHVVLDAAMGFSELRIKEGSHQATETA